MIVDGLHLAQTPLQLELFDEFIDDYSIATFIELGVYKGGLANIMIKKQSPTFKYYGYEFNRAELHSRMVDAEEISIADANDSATIAKVKSIVDASEGAVYILCDTNNKPREMTTYSRLLRLGDLLEGHDFPGEVSAEFLDEFGKSHPELEEINREEYRESGFTLWRRIV